MMTRAACNCLLYSDFCSLSKKPVFKPVTTTLAEELSTHVGMVNNDIQGAPYIFFRVTSPR